MSSELPPPPFTSKTDDGTADAARKRLTQKSRHFVSLHNLKSRSHLKTPPSSTQLVTEPLSPSTSISLDSTFLDSSDSLTDKYKWAVVYENQRGITLFSIPYYSRRSLLPFDPPPFTIPDASHSSKQAGVSLDDYPLPDGNWRWVSKCWLIDMRSDTGEVQHDGFEYNWMFRTHEWSAEVGPCSAGGWVRRRRWIRLMMRPARPQILHGQEFEGQSTSSVSTWYHQSVASSLSHLAKNPQSDATHNSLDLDMEWSEDDVEGNWQKCRSLMKHLGRDGRKLEFWKAWLAPHLPDHASGVPGNMRKGKDRDSDMMPSDAIDVSTVFARTAGRLQPPSKEYLIPVLRLHGNELVHSFVYPESRAKFMTILEEAGLLHVLELGIGLSTSGIDFWSYIDGMEATQD